MIEWLQTIFQFLDNELGQPTATRAIVCGMVCAWAITQTLKFFPEVRNLSEPWRRTAIRAIAFVTGATPTYALWPAHQPRAALLVAIAVGLAAPTAYVIVVRTAVRFMPWLAHISVSAGDDGKQDNDDTGNSGAG